MEQLQPTDNIPSVLYSYHTDTKKLIGFEKLWDKHPEIIQQLRRRNIIKNSDVIGLKKLFLHSASDASWYAETFKDLGEDVLQVIKSDISVLWLFAEKLKRRLVSLEPILIQGTLDDDPKILGDYLKKFIKSRWPELEKELLKDSKYKQVAIVNYLAALTEWNQTLPNRLLNQIKRDENFGIDVLTDAKFGNLEHVAKLAIVYKIMGVKIPRPVQALLITNPEWIITFTNALGRRLLQLETEISKPEHAKTWWFKYLYSALPGILRKEQIDQLRDEWFGRIGIRPGIRNIEKFINSK